MAALFPVRTGVWSRLGSTSAGGGLITVEGVLANQSIIVTQFSFAQSARVQYKPTLGGSIYVYPLGDNMGDIRISGLVAWGTCSGGGVGDGFSALANFYAGRKASKIKNIQSPVKITLPGMSNYTSNCFLETLSISGVDPENRVFGYELGFKSAPAS